MPGDDGDKTEAPTPRRKTEARERGQVAKSSDFSSAILLVVGMLSMRWFAPNLMAGLLEIVKGHLFIEGPAAASRVDLPVLVASVGLTMLTAAGPILFCVLIAALVANLLQVGMLFTTHPLIPKLDKLNPINGIKRLFSTRVLMQFAMNLVKLALVSLVFYVAVKDRLDDILLALGVCGWHQAVVLASVLFDVGLQLAVVLLVLALFDFAWQKYKHEKDLRMSKQEVKEEMRRMEGDPLIRQRRRKMQFAAAIQRIKSAVPTADVVVTNPTQLAIAIKYDAKTMHAPTVVAKGQNLLARKIREVAIQHGVPILERKALAQSLYKLVEVGQEVPERFYKAIAEILAYVYELSGKAKRRARAPAA
ncbi:MAG: flagellar biosynthesis protein FlhB [Planctomycetota bacterium]